MQNPKSAAIYANRLAAAFQTRTRPDGEKFVCLRDGSPQWMTDAIHAAHGDILPDDWAYNMCRQVADSLAETDPDDWDDTRAETCDALTDVYNARLLRWAASHLDRMGYCDEAIEDGTCDPRRGLAAILQAGQFREIEAIHYALSSAVENQADDEPCAYVAGWNMPGYMPDSDPAGFEDADEARACVAAEMRRYADDECAGEYADSVTESDRVAAALRDAADECEAGAGEYGRTVGGLHYWITRGE